MSKTTPIALWRAHPWRVDYALAFGLGSGLSPWMPGTCGTLLACPLYLLAIMSGVYIYSVILVVVTLFGFYICHRAAHDLGTHDHAAIVWDEIVGFGWTMFLVPSHGIWLLLGFILFRLFDIIKPFPIGYIDRVCPGGIGIMADDLMAALYANLCLQICIYAGWFH